MPKITITISGPTQYSFPADIEQTGVLFSIYGPTRPAPVLSEVAPYSASFEGLDPGSYTVTATAAAADGSTVGAHTTEPFDVLDGLATPVEIADVSAALSIKIE